MIATLFRILPWRRKRKREKGRRKEGRKEGRKEEEVDVQRRHSDYTMISTRQVMNDDWFEDRGATLLQRWIVI